MSRPPEDHPKRLQLANEVHARPPEALSTPERATYLAVVVDEADRPRERAHVEALCAHFGVAPPAPGASHFSGRLGPLRLKWERHSEFSSYTVYAAGRSPRPFSEPAAGFLPAGWLGDIPGRTIAAAHGKLVPAPADPADPALLQDHFEGQVAIGAEIGDGAGFAFTDFHIHEDGFTRFLVFDRGFTPRQAGRMLQRLFEIEAYRTMALLALPIAREQGPRIQTIDRSLAALTDHIAREAGSDEALLGELTALAAEVESAQAASQYRFGASRAYHDLVRTRIAELRERRIAGIQTIDEFMTRRLAPAMTTCASVSQRLRDLSERVAQASALLSTRVDIAREKQNQALLASMERRARHQLRLQETVEGLSIAAITYYGVGLVAYGAKALKAAGLHIDTDVAVGVGIPVVGLLVALALRRARQRIHHAVHGRDDAG